MKNSKSIVNVQIGNSILKCIIPKSNEEGLNNYTKKDLKDFGMLFHFPSKDIRLISDIMKFPIRVLIIENYKLKDIIDLEEDSFLDAVGIYAIELNTDNPILNKIKLDDYVNIKYNNDMPTLKVKVGNKIKTYKVGGEPFKYDVPSYENGSNIELSKDIPRMFLLDENGSVQMTMNGRERIFSQDDTKLLMSFIKKEESDKTFIELGKVVAGIVKKHATQPKETVDRPNNK